MSYQYHILADAFSADLYSERLPVYGAFDFNDRNWQIACYCGTAEELARILGLPIELITDRMIVLSKVPPPKDRLN